MTAAIRNTSSNHSAESAGIHSAPSLISPVEPEAGSPPAFAAPEGAIVNPGNPHHFMIVRPVQRRVRVSVGSTILAETTDAVRVLEFGRTLYDPVLYIPADDVSGALTPLASTTHCPLKGDADYFAHNGVEIAWSYRKPFDWASDLAGRRAFWADKVRIEEGI